MAPARRESGPHRLGCRPGAGASRSCCGQQSWQARSEVQIRRFLNRDPRWRGRVQPEVRLPLGRRWVEVVEVGVFVKDEVRAQLAVVEIVDQHEGRLAHRLDAQAEAGMGSFRAGVVGEESVDEGINEVALLNPSQSPTAFLKSCSLPKLRAWAARNSSPGGTSSDPVFCCRPRQRHLVRTRPPSRQLHCR